MHSDYQGIVPSPPLDGAAGAEQELVAARERELQQALEGDETDCQNQRSTHTEPPVAVRS